ncbi:Holliday junction resolvase RuvX [Alicyclobacillus fructus]|uniref:Holliday junction resolvase RuvX n=1 Tax=Alicyclobacillus fructus TaxID=2816082 RepID=UPI001A8C0889|nr:Holliday junction resolvase RuvX [Alicyclobacillus fructus]
MAVDFGERRIGVALSDPTGLIAQPYGFVERQSDRQAADDVAAIALREEVGRIVVGRPLHMSGQPSEMTLRAEKFARMLAARTGLPVDLYDERLTTVSAERILMEQNMRRKQRRAAVDAAAAQVLLEDYLRSRRRADRRQDDESEG